MTNNVDSNRSPILAKASLAALEAFVPKPGSTTPGQKEALVSLWISEDKKTEVGIWEATPGAFTASRVRYHEVCQILSGSATIEPTGESAFDLSAGDTFVTPNGWAGTWMIHETMRKVFVKVNV